MTQEQLRVLQQIRDGKIFTIDTYPLGTHTLVTSGWVTFDGELKLTERGKEFVETIERYRNGFVTIIERILCCNCEDSGICEKDCFNVSEIDEEAWR